MKAIGLGILASLFFASTFVLNQTMSLHGGSWLWTSSLRYFYTVPVLAIWVAWRGELPKLASLMTRRPWPWFLWGTVGFGLFYAPLTFAAVYGPSWAVASTFQLTIIIGSLLVPFTTHQKIPWRHLWPSVPILAGIAMVQWQSHVALNQSLFVSLAAVLLSAVAYPLGNRKMMALTTGDISAVTRILGMTIGSLPFWIVLAGIASVSAGRPPVWQWEETFWVAMSSGIVATALFFRATDQAQGRPDTLAKVEATQSMEIVFTLLLALIFHLPGHADVASIAGMALVMGGMVWHAVGRPLSKWGQTRPVADASNVTASLLDN
ncbi:hypothetical protein BXT84_04725 [Sulfobacillus thermotolerans]|uniref:Multidrug resistance efflux transporter family protein n=1 Tax=Sulfobacillus thermotolerans TaxID=338644 RepID=A0ABM6RVD3_9FIRM|nr:hypothetical protein BXT84_04725 [Sulfobacillus thermotolerans]